MRTSKHEHMAQAIGELNNEPCKTRRNSRKLPRTLRTPAGGLVLQTPTIKFADKYVNRRSTIVWIAQSLVCTCLYVCMHVCMYVCMCICTCVCLRMRFCTCLYAYDVYVCVYVYVYIRICVCLSAHKEKYVFMYTKIDKFESMLICTNVICYIYV